jgi:hypothetical protein
MSTPTFRIDDIGASTKHFNQYGKHWIRFGGRKMIPVPFANFWFFKRLPGIRRWGRYDELTVAEWQKLLSLFKQANIVPIIAVTATWVERDGTLTPFPEKFPEEAAFLKTAFAQGDIIIANHGLTHCVVGKHLPKFWGSNRRFHREFYPEFDQSLHRDHIVRSQQILEGFFERPITILVPPGNVWSKKTYHALRDTNITVVRCNRYMADSAEPMVGVSFIPDAAGSFVCHDRELKLYGAPWLAAQIALHTA